MAQVTLPLPMLAAFGLWDGLVIALYWAAMITIALWVGRGDRNARSFFVGGHSLPPWALAISLVGSALSAATFVGAPDQAYRGDISYLILNLGGILAVFIVGFWFVPRLYRAGTITIYGFLGQRFGEPARLAVAVMFILGRLLASGARLFLAAIPLCLLLFGTIEPTAWQMVAAIALIGLVGTFYTTLGGIRAVVWIDTVQFTLVILAVVLSVVILLHKIPLSLPELYHVLRQPVPASADGVMAGAPQGKLHLLDLSWDFSKPYTLWSALLGVVFLNVAVYGVDHDFAQRFLVSKSAKQGAWSVIGAQFIGIAVVMLFMGVGLLLWVYYRRPDIMGAAAPALSPTGGKEAAYPIFLLHELPPVVSGLTIAGFFAVAQGSMDSAINAMASSLIADVWLPWQRRRGQAVDEQQSSHAPHLAVALLGTLMSLMAMLCAVIYNPRTQTLLDFALGIMTFALAGMLGVYLTALFTRRGNNVSVLAALGAGVLTITLLQDAILAWWSAALFGSPLKLAWTWYMPIAVTVSFLVCVAGKPLNHVATSAASGVSPPA